MKFFLILSGLFLLTVSAENCNGKKTDANTRYKAKLEIKAICMNYTLRLLEGEADTSIVTPEWTDETTGKAYKNVFALANPCEFPADINEGDEFYFLIDTAKNKDCAVCMAYYPTPPKKTFIKVVEK